MVILACGKNSTDDSSENLENLENQVSQPIMAMPWNGGRLEWN